MSSSSSSLKQRASVEAEASNGLRAVGAKQGGPDGSSALAPTPTVGASPGAARPNTPAAVDSRAMHRSPPSVVSRSADMASVSGRPLVPIPMRTDTVPNLGMAEMELDPRGSGSNLVPQPPPAGSPAVSGNSPRLRTFSSRSLSIRASMPVSPMAVDADAAADTPELYLSQSPKIGVTACPTTPDSSLSPVVAAEAASRPSRSTMSAPQPSHSTTLSVGVSPAGTPGNVAAEAGGRQMTRPLAAAATASAFDAESNADPWVALRAHCMAAYGGDLSSEEESDGDEDSGRAGRLLLMRHPSLLTRSLSRSFGQGAVGASVAAAAVAPSARRPGTVGPDPRAASPSGAPLGTHATATAAATAVAMVSPPRGTPAKTGPVSTAAPRADATAISTAATGTGTGTVVGVGLTTRLSSPAVPGPRPGPATASFRPGAATVAGASPDLSGAALARARMAAAATLQLQSPPPPQQQKPRSQPPAGAPAGRAPMPPLPPPSPSLSPSASPLSTASAAVGTSAAHWSESGTSSTASAAVPAGLLGTPPKPRRGISAAAAAAGASAGGPPSAGIETSPFATASAHTAAGTPYPAHAPALVSSPNRSPLHRPQQPGHGADRGMVSIGGAAPDGGDGTGACMAPFGSTSAMAALEAQLQNQLLLSPLEFGGGGGGGGTSGGGNDQRVSETGGVATGAGSILDVAPDPVRKRRLSADGLSRYASKYGTGGGAGGGGGGGSSSDGTAPAAASPAEGGSAAGRSVNVDSSVAGGVGGAAAPGATPASPGGAASTSSSPSASSGRAPLISALAFERAPWSAPAGGAGGHHAAAGTAAVPPGDGSVAAKMFRSQHPPLPRVPGLPPHRPHSGLGLAASPRGLTPFDRAGVDFAAGVAPGVLGRGGGAAANITAVDKLRGYKSSRILLGPSTSASGNIPMASGALGADAGGGGGVPSANPTAVTGLSPPSSRPKLGPFTSLRTIRTTATASSFLDRLSGSSNLAGSAGPSRASSRRTIGGGVGSGGGGAGEWGPEGSGQRSFRRREGSYSLDGSGCDLPGFTSDSLQQHVQYGREDGGSSNAGTGSKAWMLAGSSGLAGLHARRSYNQLLPRGPNGLPLAWSAIEEEDSDGGEGGGSGRAEARARTQSGNMHHASAAEEGKDGGRANGDDEDEDDDGFNRLARAGGWVDLNQTC